MSQSHILHIITMDIVVECLLNQILWLIAG